MTLRENIKEIWSCRISIKKKGGGEGVAKHTSVQYKIQFCQFCYKIPFSCVELKIFEKSLKLSIFF